MLISAGRSLWRSLPLASGNRSRYVLAGLMMASLMAAPAMAIDFLDPGFAGIGATEVNLSHRDTSAALHVDSTGRIYVLGMTKHSTLSDQGNDAMFDAANQYLARFLPDGSVDTSFGGFGDAPDGYAVIDYQMMNSFAIGLVTLDDGAIMTAAVSQSDDQASVILSRFTDDGWLDESFGQLGRQLIDLGDRYHFQRGDIGLVNDRLYVWCGSCVMRLSLDGILDPTFAVGGFMDAGNFAAPNHNIFDLSLRDGVMVVGTNAYHDFADSAHLRGFDLDGNVLPGFGSGGLIDLTAHITGEYTPLKIAVNDQQITAGLGNRILRVGFDGVLDAGFGYSGVVQLPGSGWVTDLILQPYGTTAFSFALHDHEFLPLNQYAIARLSADGTPDDTFGNAHTNQWKGWLRLDWGTSPKITNLFGYANGKVLAAGWYRVPVGPVDNVTLMRTEGFSNEMNLPPIASDGLTTFDPTHDEDGFDQWIIDDTKTIPADSSPASSVVLPGGHAEMDESLGTKIIN